MKHNGDNYHNNVIDIDIKKEKVMFRPIKIKKAFFKYYYSFLLELMMLSFIFSSCFVIALSLSTFIYFSDNVDYTFIMTLICFIPLAITIILSFKYFDGDWRKNKYPMIEAKLSNICSYIFRYKSAYKEHTINNTDCFMGNKLIIPNFQNVSLEYKAYGEFGTHLKRIFVNNAFEDNPYVWNMFFEYDTLPKTGKLIIRYI